MSVLRKKQGLIMKDYIDMFHLLKKEECKTSDVTVNNRTNEV